ncbi:hypothetical protein [uncultured Roseovarius sp.]|uniref:hypothetical protein n=1 Tax=uncultured Roseovarius sp. TaxID=293344 RepID=UPI00263A3B6A|nr:hypothetical protein [uncultured Roseovarius sp.]
MLLRKSVFISAVCSSLVLTGCNETTLGGSPFGTSSSSQSGSVKSIAAGKTREEIALEREVANLDKVTRNIVIKNVLQGAAAGAALGCAIAAIGGGKCGRGALYGAGAGAVAGGVVGQKAATAKRELVQADQTIARLKGVNQRLNGIEKNLRSVVRRQNSEIASLRRQLAAGQVSKSSVDARISAINNNRKTISSGLQKSEKNMANEKAKLVSAEKQNGQKLTNTKRAVDSTSNRLKSLRGTVKLVSS